MYHVSRPKKSWDETREEFRKRMAGIARDINKTLDVEGACRSFVDRLAQVVESGGDRLVRGNSES